MSVTQIIKVTESKKAGAVDQCPSPHLNLRLKLGIPRAIAELVARKPGARSINQSLINQPITI
jgi:hypothetical protein